MKKDSPLSVYAVAGQLGFVIATPLVLFIGGGSRLVDGFGWPDRTKIVFVLLGIAVMVAAVASYLRSLVGAYEDLSDRNPPALDKRDYDYYEDKDKG
ncbi:MAG: hypothetical protein LBI36_06015 [Oscillospiraceae bacterium]|jgi:hypothetical protein|nr:hypothetical protein [Oscillospiraceae bacterium]